MLKLIVKTVKCYYKVGGAGGGDDGDNDEE